MASLWSVMNYIVSSGTHARSDKVYKGVVSVELETGDL